MWLQISQQQLASDSASCLEGCHPKPASYLHSMCCAHKGCFEGSATVDDWQAYLPDEVAAIHNQTRPQGGLYLSFLCSFSDVPSGCLFVALCRIFGCLFAVTHFCVWLQTSIQTFCTSKLLRVAKTHCKCPDHGLKRTVTVAWYRNKS